LRLEPRPVPSRPLGLLLIWALGLAALLGTLVVTLSRGLGVPRGTGPAAEGEAFLLPPPLTVERPRWSDAYRVDTLPQLLSVGAAVDVDSGWVLLDPRARQVVVLPNDPESLPLRFGREGDGPGELQSPSFLAVSGDQVGVLEARGDRLVRFDLSGRVLGPVGLTDGGCAFGPGQSLLGHPSGGFVVVRTCTGMDGSMRGLYQRVGPEGDVDLLLDLALQPGGRFDPFRVPVAAVLDGTLLAGTLSDGCLWPLDPESDGEESITLCVPTSERLPLPDSIRIRLEALAVQASRVGRRLEMPDFLPTFIEVRSSTAGPLLSIPSARGPEALDLLGPGGGRTRFEVSAPNASFVGRKEVLLVRDLLVGTALARIRRDG